MKSNNNELQNLNVSYIIAGSVLTGFFIFVAGYYWGKQTSISKLTEETNKDYLYNKIESSIYNQTNNLIDDNKEEERDQSPYYAQLAGFASLNTAKLSLKKLNNVGIDANLITRTSKTNRGIKKNWYQLITKVMAKDELDEQLKKAKNIIDISQVIFVKQ